MAEGTWVGLDVHARKVVAGVLDAGSGELRSLLARPPRGDLLCGSARKEAHGSTFPDWGSLAVPHRGGVRGSRRSRACLSIPAIGSGSCYWTASATW